MFGSKGSIHGINVGRGICEGGKVAEIAHRLVIVDGWLVARRFYEFATFAANWAEGLWRIVAFFADIIDLRVEFLDAG